ncbi:MAG: hypothetical protein ABSF95_00360 [Verrucomicrobiota bacterium]|jgi:hypothetical protein
MKPKQNELNGEQGRAARHFLQLCLLPLFMVMVWAGCKQEGKVAADTKTVAATTADINPVGTYTLVTVDGNKVPCTMQHEGHTMTIKSGSFIINADGTCSSKMSLAGREAAIEVKASYTRQGSTLTMQWERAGMTTGTVEGDTFTMNNEGMVFAYRK